MSVENESKVIESSGEAEKAADGQRFASFVQDLYKGAEKLWSDARTPTGSAASDSVLPKMELSEARSSEESGETMDASLARRRAKDMPESEAIKDAKATVLNPESSQEEKLKAANELARLGESSFTGPDGRKYSISHENVGNRSLVSIHTLDKDNQSHAVLRGIVEKDGSVSKQRDSDGKEVPYESHWATTHLKDSPLVGSREKAEDAPASAEREHLMKTLKEKGIAPPELSHAERTRLADEHGKLEGQLAAARAKHEAVKKEVEARNKPVQAEIDRLAAKQDALYEKPPTNLEIGKQNEKLATQLKDAGIGDGKTLGVDQLHSAETFKQLRERVDEKVSDPARKAELKAEIDKLEKMGREDAKRQAEWDKLEAAKEPLFERLDKNNKPLDDAVAELRDVRKALRANEEKLREGKFAEDLKEIDKLPQEKREAVYKALEQIANDSGGPPNRLSVEQRKHLVEQVAHQIAHPETIKQGNKGTCGIASTELELAKNHPEKYARYMADLATRGETTLADGSKLKIDPEMINTTDEDGNLVPHDDGNKDRTLASKIFQTAGANRVLEFRAAAQTPPEQPSRYVSERPGSEKAPFVVGDAGTAVTRDFRPSEDSGERIIDPDGKMTAWDGVDHSEIQALTSAVTGEKYEAQPVVKGRDLSNPEQAAAAEKEFIDQLDKNGLPTKVSITLVKGDFTGMNSEGGHELVITRVEKGPPAMVYYENTAGGADHSYPSGTPVPLKAFLKSMQETRMSDGRTHVEGYLIVKKK